MFKIEIVGLMGNPILFSLFQIWNCVFLRQAQTKPFQELKTTKKHNTVTQQKQREESV